MANLCEASGGNTGNPSCDLKGIVTIGVIFVPKKAVIPAGTDDLKAFLQGKFIEPLKANRWLPLFDNLAITNSSEEAVIGTLANGYSEKLRDGNAIYQFDFPFGLCKSKTLNQFDGWNGGIFLVSKDVRIVGRKQSDGSLAALAPSSVYVTGGALGDGQNVLVTSLIVNFGDSGRLLNVIDVTDKIEDFDTEEMAGITDLQLVAGATATGTVDVKVQTKCDGVNLYDLYKTALSDASAWAAVNKATGATATVTTVTAQDATKSLRLSLTAGSYLLSLAALSVLEPLGMEGYESNQISVTVS